MRRLVALLAVAGCLLCGGCAKKEVPPVTEGFSCAVKVTAGDFSAAGTLTRTGAGQLQFACTAPDTLAGLCVSVCGDEVTLSRAGVSVAFSKTAFSQEAVFLRLCRLLDAAARCQTATGGVIKGVCQNEPYTLTYDVESGQYATLRLQNARFFVAFSDFSPK